MSEILVLKEIMHRFMVEEPRNANGTVGYFLTVLESHASTLTWLAVQVPEGASPTYYICKCLM